MVARSCLGRLLLALLSSAACLGAIDAWMRTKIGACGLTPFGDSAVEALPHELVPGRVTTYKGVTVRINRDGFRGAEIVDPPPGAERIALVGDSVTFGNGCPEEGTLSVELERELARRGHPAQVLNCGVPGYNAANVATLARERVLALRPQRLLYVMVANDVSRSQRRVPIPQDGAIDARAEFPLGSPLLQFLGIRGSALLRAVGFHPRGYVASLVTQFENGGGERVGRALEELARLCREKGIEFRVAIYPALGRLDHDPFAAIEADCARRCAELSVTCHSIGDAFAPDEDLTKYWVAFLDGHPDAAANAIAARFLAERLVN